MRLERFQSSDHCCFQIHKELILLSNPTADDEEKLTLKHYVIVGLIALLMSYLTFGVVRSRMLPESQRTLSTILFPFGRTMSAEKLHQRGVKQYSSGEYRKALDSFARSLDRKPGNVKGLFLLGSSLIRLKRFTEGLEILDKAKSVDSGFNRIYIKRAYVLLGLGDYARATKAADRYIERTDASDASKAYGYLVKMAAERLNPGESSAELSSLYQESGVGDLPQSSLVVKLARLLADRVEPEDLLNGSLNRGEETELKGWAAVDALAENQTGKASEWLKWVLTEGDDGRYEYDLALALSSRTTAY
ncbi:MAG: tetratricopeptide repeat protein [bacterium]